METRRLLALTIFLILLAHARALWLAPSLTRISFPFPSRFQIASCNAGPSCLPELGYNPLNRWNVISLANIGTADVPYGGTDFQGRLLALGNVWLAQFTAHGVLAAASPDDTEFSATCGGSFSQCGGDVNNGGVEAGLGVQAGVIDGNVVAAGGPITAPPSGCGAGTINGDASSSSTIAAAVDVTGTRKDHQSGLGLSVSLADVSNYVETLSAIYAGKTAHALAHITDGWKIEVELDPGLNVVTLSAATLKTATNLYLTYAGNDQNAWLVINVPDTGVVQFDSLTVTLNGATPTYGVLLINYHGASALKIEGEVRATILAVGATTTFKSGTVWGNLIVGALKGYAEDQAGQVNTVSGQCGQVNNVPWTGPNPCPPPPPSPHGDQGVPSPPCPENPPQFSFNPWDRWNVVSLDGVGECGLPYGTDFQGRLLAVGSVYVAQFTVHMVEGTPDANYPWSATVGGTYYQCGGDSMFGGVEAQNDLWIGDIAGNAVSAAGSIHAVPSDCGGSKVNGNAKVAGTVDSGVEVTGIKIVGTPSSLSVSVDDVAAYFLAVSSSYCSSATTTQPSLTITDTVVRSIDVELNDAVTIIEVSAQDLLTATDLYITSSIAGAVLVINVKDSGDLAMDSLNVHVNDVTPPTTGILLINYCNAATLDLTGGTYASILAPNTDVTFRSGVLWGNLIVGSLHAFGDTNGCEQDENGAPIGGQSGQVNVQPFNVQPGQSGQANNIPFNPQCPPAPTTEADSKKVVAAAKRGRAERKQKSKGRKVTTQAAQATRANVFHAAQQSTHWMWAFGGAAAGIALSALVVAGVVFSQRRRPDRRAAKRLNGSLTTPVAQSPAAWSPQSTLSRRGSSRFPASP